MYGYVIFTDIEKYSSLKDAELKIYFNKIIPIISQELKIYKDSAIIWNTWGDAIFAIYDKAEAAINMALAYREAFNKLDFSQFGIRKLTPRIAGNFGEFELIFDPVSGKQNVHGTLVNLTARIEPVTTPGEIFVTKEFKEMSISSYDKVDNVRFEDMGEINLPKNAGKLNLFRLCKKAEMPIKPAGLLLSNIDYKVQAPINFASKSGTDIKPTHKSIEQRLSKNLNKKTTSDEKLNKLVNVLKEDKNLSKKQANFIEVLIRDLKFKKNPKDLLVKNPFLIAVLVFVIAMSINFTLDKVIAKHLSDLSKSNIFMATVNSWIWLKGYIISSFIVGQVITFFQKKIITIQNLVITPLLVLILHLILYIFPNGSAPSSVSFIQNLYLNVFVLWSVCFIGFYKGTEYANDKIKASSGNRK